MDLLENFRNKQIIRNQIQCPQTLNIILDHFQYEIHSEFDKNSKQTYRYKKKKHLVNPFMVNAFQTLNRQEKIRLYIRMVTHAQNLSKGIQAQPPVSEVKMKPIQGMCQCKSFNLKIWKLKNIRLDRTRHQVMVENQKDGKIKTYHLKNYLIRRSKTKNKFALVLQCINSIPPEKSRQVHIAFQDEPTLRLWYNLIREQVEVCQWLNVRALFLKLSNGLINSSASQSSKSQNKDLLNSSITSIDVLSKKQLQIQANDISVESILNEQKKLDEKEYQIFGKRKTFIQRLVNDDCADFEQFFDIIDEQTPQDVQSKKNLDFFHKLMPDYNLQDLTKSYQNYQQLIENQDRNFVVSQNKNSPEKFKVLVSFNSNQFNAKNIFCLISEARFILTINNNIEQLSVKTLLKSQNSAIMYQTLKAYNKFYRMRDFVFVRHAFAHNGNFYLVDKSIDNINFPPFMTLVRGEISALWGIFKDEEKNQITLTGELTIVNSGLLNSQQETNLSLKYLSGFKELLKVKPDSGMESSMFDIEWDIDKKEENKQLDEIRMKRKTVNEQMLKIMTKNSKQQEELSFAKKSSSIHQVPINPQGTLKLIKNKSSAQKLIPQSDKKHTKEQKPYVIEISSKQNTPQKVQKNNSPQKKVIEKDKFYTQFEIIRKIDNQGFVIINQNYINRKFFVSPTQKISYQELKIIKGHAIWKGEWIHDNKQGGMIYINQKKIDDQKGVLKFILTKIGKNILSGKSILNISLPVDIFCAESNLQRLLVGMVYAPKLLEDLNHMPLLQKLARVVCFGVSNSVMYIAIEKPFNPILGETFQCWINGCPAYGQQISHHPPIAALLLVGRGYRVSGQLESKVELHMNSGCGMNDGIYKVSFDDGAQICFMTPGGQISGLTFGQRKLNLVGKSYYWSQKDRILLQLNYQAGKKSFFSKQQKTCDYFEGKVYEVTADFFKTFPKVKRREPSDKEKVKELGTFEGIWNKYVKFNNKEIFNFDQVLPLRLEYESHPLASDSNWREDIEYRRLNKITRAQAQKERLQVLQRNDRKYRQKYHKKK